MPESTNILTFFFFPIMICIYGVCVSFHQWHMPETTNTDEQDARLDVVPLSPDLVCLTPCRHTPPPMSMLPPLPPVCLTPCRHTPPMSMLPLSPDLLTEVGELARGLVAQRWMELPAAPVELEPIDPPAVPPTAPSGLCPLETLIGSLTVAPDPDQAPANYFACLQETVQALVMDVRGLVTEGQRGRGVLTHLAEESFVPVIQRSFIEPTKRVAALPRISALQAAVTELQEQERLGQLVVERCVALAGILKQMVTGSAGVVMPLATLRQDLALINATHRQYGEALGQNRSLLEAFQLQCRRELEEARHALAAGRPLLLAKLRSNSNVIAQKEAAIVCLLKDRMSLQAARRAIVHEEVEAQAKTLRSLESVRVRLEEVARCQDRLSRTIDRERAVEALGRTLERKFCEEAGRQVQLLLTTRFENLTLNLTRATLHCTQQAAALQQGLLFRRAQLERSVTSMETAQQAVDGLLAQMRRNHTDVTGFLQTKAHNAATIAHLRAEQETITGRLTALAESLAPLGVTLPPPPTTTGEPLCLPDPFVISKEPPVQDEVGSCLLCHFPLVSAPGMPRAGRGAWTIQACAASLVGVFPVVPVLTTHLLRRGSTRLVPFVPTIQRKGGGSQLVRMCEAKGVWGHTDISPNPLNGRGIIDRRPRTGPAKREKKVLELRRTRTCSLLIRITLLGFPRKHHVPLYVLICVVLFGEASIVKATGDQPPCYIAHSGQDHSPCTDINQPCFSMDFAVHEQGCTSLIITSSTLNITQTIFIPQLAETFSISSPAGTTITCMGSSSALSGTVLPTSALHSLILTNLTFANCTDPNFGGAVRINTTSPQPLAISVQSCAFTGCHAGCGGGCVDVWAGPESGGITISIDQSLFHNGRVALRECTTAEGHVGGAALRVLNQGSPNTGRVSVTRCHFSENVLATSNPTMTFFATGGAIMLFQVGNVSLISTNFTNNEIWHAGGGLGGAVYLENAVRVDVDAVRVLSSTVQSYSSDASGAFVILSPGQQPLSDAHISIHGCTFMSNSAESGVNQAHGAALLIDQFPGPAVLSDCIFANNSAEGSSVGLGGALYAVDVTGGVTLIRSSFSANIADGMEAHGGAVYAVSTPTTISACVFSGCSVRTDGLGAGSAVMIMLPARVVVVDQTTFRGNRVTAGRQEQLCGGALSVANNDQLAPIRIRGSAFFDNAISSTARAGGGGLAVMFPGSAELSVVNCTFSGNRVSASPVFGGGLMVSGGLGGVSLDNCTFDQNSILGPTAKGGGAYLAARQIAINQCVFHQNTIEAGTTAAGAGLSLEKNGDTSATISNCYFVENSLSSAGGASGMGIYTDNLSNITIVRSSFWRNKAAGLNVTGGAMALYAPYDAVARVTLHAVQIGENHINCQKWCGGVGMFLIGQQTTIVTITSCHFGQNGMLGDHCYGGALMLSGLMYLHMADTWLADNWITGSTTASGGALAVEDSLVRGLMITNCTFSNNTVSSGTQSTGGAVAIADRSQHSSPIPVLFEGVTFVGNLVQGKGTAEGGALFVHGSSTDPKGWLAVDLIDCTLLRNLGDSLSGRGGAVSINPLFSDSGAGGNVRVNLVRVNFTENEMNTVSESEGGGLYTTNDVIATLSWVIFTSNRVTGKTSTGGAFSALAPLYVALDNVSFIENYAIASVWAAGGALAIRNFSDMGTYTSVLDSVHFRKNIVLCPGCVARGGALYLEHMTQSILNEVTFVGATMTAVVLPLFEAGGCLFARGQFHISNSTFTGCQAQNGGGMMVAGGAAVKNCSFVECRASNEGGAALVNGPATFENCACQSCQARTGGCISATSGTSGPASTATPLLLLSQSSFISNGAVQAGGALAAVSSYVHAADCVFDKNWVEAGGGGALSIQGTYLLLDRANLSENVAREGAALSATLGSQVASTDVRYLLNSAHSGAVWFLSHSDLNATRDHILGSESNYGSGFFQDAVVRLTDTHWNFNRAYSSGGAIEACASQVEISGSEFRGCMSTLGGVIHMENHTRVVATDSVFSGNVATSGGAVYSWTDSEWNFTRCLFASNQAQFGGAICSTFDRSLWLVESQFTGNVATREGSGVFFDVPSIIAHQATDAQYRLAVDRCRFERQIGGSRTVPDAVPGAVISLNAVNASLSETAFDSNFGGALLLQKGARATLGTGCRFSGNSALVGPHVDRSVNIWMQGASAVTVGDLEPMTDPAMHTLWIYADATSQIDLSSDNATLLPLLAGTIRGATPGSPVARFQVPLLRVTGVDLASVNSWANYAPVCYFVVAGEPVLSMPFVVSNASNPEGSCVLPDSTRTARYTLLLSNDGHQNITVGTFETYIDYQATVTHVLIGAGVALAVGVLVLLGYITFRWLRLRRATSIELASWRSYQVATVDFANLKILQRIGHGAAGEVFKGDLNGTTVAVKRLFDTSQSAAQLADFKREVAMMRTLRHPYIVALIGATFENPKLIITEFMGRGSLFTLLHDETVRMPTELRLRMALDMAKGLNYLHTLRPPILHRDIKSQNMLVTDDLRVKVSDFGISRLSQEAGITTAAGTPAYLRRVRTDTTGWYVPGSAPNYFPGLSVVLWELATRQVPWADTPPLRVMMTVAGGARLPIPDTADCPPVLADLIRRCFEEKPEARPTMQQVVDLLGPAVDSHPHTDSSAGGPPRRSSRRPSRKQPADASTSSSSSFRADRSQPLLVAGEDAEPDL
ncbi:putative Serine/threonine-protein kinase CTR1 [Paratrimastix pyriformis]|uniref:Serine/threonine-protein kinase CTR1 n=1 Tax=Paratrimastix pyriformis TaxID=342808 RepID=A0ABQ8UP09_9EUKA|nr:putative Serine/threonine-protein kinase CTR1 [Paratrimastix pyriformis]